MLKKMLLALVYGAISIAACIGLCVLILEIGASLNMPRWVFEFVSTGLTAGPAVIILYTIAKFYNAWRDEKDRLC